RATTRNTKRTKRAKEEATRPRRPRSAQTQRVRPAAGNAGRVTRRKERRKHKQLARRTVCVCGAHFRLAARFAGGRTLSLFRVLRVFFRVFRGLGSVSSGGRP